MIVKYKYGIEHNGMIYGWKNGKLHRLPQVYNKRFLALKQLPLITIGRKKGYRLSGDRLTLDQLKYKTIFINQMFQEIRDSDCPF